MQTYALSTTIPRTELGKETYVIADCKSLPSGPSEKIMHVFFNFFFKCQDSSHAHTHNYSEWRLKNALAAPSTWLIPLQDNYFVKRLNKKYPRVTHHL